MTKAEWLELATRCEAATGPDGETDAALTISSRTAPANYQYPLQFSDWRTLGTPGQVGIYNTDGVLSGWWNSARYTASLDAIVALIERELPGWSWSVGNMEDGTGYGACLADHELTGGPEPWNEERFVAEGHTATPALALCAAFCKAMSEKADG